MKNTIIVLLVVPSYKGKITNENKYVFNICHCVYKDLFRHYNIAFVGVVFVP
jgi:hypothetical protein